MRRLFRNTLVIGLSALFALLAGCQPAPEPVGSVAISPAEIDLPFAGYAKTQITWKMTRDLDQASGSWRGLLHLLDTDGALVRTFDHPGPGEWKAGGEASYEVVLYQSALGPALDAGTYRLTAGIYDSTGKRWALADSGAEVNEGEYEVGSANAGLRADSVPDIQFSEEWLPVDGGTDLQILGRRWLGSTGTIRLTRIKQPGSFWVRVGIPEGGREGQTLRISDGSDQPVATVTASCSGFSADLSGSGGHTLEVPITLTPENGQEGDPAGCELTFSANYELISQRNQERRTIALENLAWAE